MHVWTYLSLSFNLSLSFKIKTCMKQAVFENINKLMHMERSANSMILRVCFKFPLCINPDCILIWFEYVICTSTFMLNIRVRCRVIWHYFFCVQCGTSKWSSLVPALQRGLLWHVQRYAVWSYYTMCRVLHIYLHIMHIDFIYILCIICTSNCI